MGRGGALVESMPFARRVVGSNPALAAMYGPWTSPPEVNDVCFISETNFWRKLSRNFENFRLYVENVTTSEPVYNDHGQDEFPLKLITFPYFRE